MTDTSGPPGTWYLFANWHPGHHDGYKQTAIISDDTISGTFVGAFVNEKDNVDVLDNISWDSTARMLEFRRMTVDGSNLWQWYRGKVVEGIFMGRFSQSHDSANKPDKLNLTSYKYHVSGWNSEYIDRINNKNNNIVPRVYNITVHDEDTENTYSAWLRIDYSIEHEAFIGRLKETHRNSDNAQTTEGLEYDIKVTHWDGTILRFIKIVDPNRPHQEWYGVVSGRNINGTYYTATDPPDKKYAWKGVRAQVLSYGLSSKTPGERAAWQERTRLQLKHLIMTEEPPVESTVTTVKKSNLDPFHSPGDGPHHRDDDPANHPQDYRLTELEFKHTIANPYYDSAAPPNSPQSTSTIQRESHGFLAIPTTPPPRDNHGRYPAVIALNGHHGTAHKVMEPKGGKPDHIYWYGDSFARRGFVVLAIDIGHRPNADTRGLYDDDYNDDDAGTDDPPYNGEGHNHPAIRAPGFDSDWAEDGERAWDAMRGLDYLLSLRDGESEDPKIDPNQIIIVGLSMGGEVTTIAGALDPRFALIIPACFSPDLACGKEQPRGAHCLPWLNADFLEYIDTSDCQALMAPRPVIIETGKLDQSYSLHNPSFSGDKQVIRRSRAAYGTEVANLVHYLHYDVHRFHIGDVNPHYKPIDDKPTDEKRGVRVPDIFEPPSAAPFSTNWQTDRNTHIDKPTLYDYVKFFLRIH